MTYKFGRSALTALGTTATAAAGYVDACDAGATSTRLDPAHYQTCGALLFHIFSMLDARAAFPALMAQSAAAREIYESITMSRRLEVGRLIYYPQLSALLKKISA